MAGGETEFGAVFCTSPVEHGVPKGGTDTLTANAFVGDKIFKVGDTTDDGSHDDGKSGDADDMVVVVESEKHVVEWGSDEIFEPFAWYFAAVAAATGELD